MAIKAIIFDCFGVLSSSGHSLLYRDFSNKLDDIKMYEDKTDRGIFSREQFNESIAKLTGLTAQEVENKYWKINQIDQLVVDWIIDLRSIGKYKIGMLSNVNRELVGYLLPLFENKEYFDDFVLSSDEGIIKPNPKIFKLAAKRLGCSPSECIMIDDKASNIEGAKMAGMNGIVFKSIDQAKEELDHILELDNA